MRKSRFKLGIAPDQRIELGVADLRRVFGVVEPVVPGDGFRQPHQLIGGLGFGQIAHTLSSSRSACARASWVISAPESMRAISSFRPGASRSATLVRVTVPCEVLWMT